MGKSGVLRKIPRGTWPRYCL